MLVLLSMVLMVYLWGQLKPGKKEAEEIQIIQAVSEEKKTAPELQIKKRMGDEQETGEEEKRTAHKNTAAFEAVSQGNTETGREEDRISETGYIASEEVVFQAKADGPLSEAEISGEIRIVDDTAGTEGSYVSAETALVREVETSGMELPEVTDITSQTSQTTAPDKTEETAAGSPAGPPLYSVNGAVMPEEIQVHLYNALAAGGIGWFMPYAVMIAYQESRFNTAAENRNGLDKGLFQYRVTYWSYGDIYSPYDQINVFVQQMVNRAAAGCTVSDMISRHKQSDWGTYDQVYVEQVMQWANVTVRIR